VNEGIAQAFTIFLYILIALVVARAILSWIPLRPGNEFARFVHRATEPLLEPVRRLLPSVAGIDFSPILVIVVLQLMVVVVNRAAD
jgi:YggT family protein